MDRIDFDAPVERRGTASIKWDRYGARDVLPLWVADMDFQVPPAVTAALARRVEHGIYGYTHAPTGIVAAFQHYTQHRFGWQVEPEWLVWLPGAVAALHVACRLLAPGDQVAVATPVYPPFREAPAHMQRGCIEVPLVYAADGRAQRDLDGFARAFAAGARLAFLCNPQNPTGQVADRDELAAFAERVLAHDVTVVSDELHADLVLDPARRHQPLAALSPAIAARTITLLAPSKTFNLAGLGLTCAVIPDAGLRQRFRSAAAGILPLVTTLAWVAGEAAWREGWDWHAQLIDSLRANRDFVAARLAALPRVRARPPEATYLYWLDLSDYGFPNAARQLEAHGLGVWDGADFGAPGHVRLNFACPRATLAAGLDRLGAALR